MPYDFALGVGWSSTSSVVLGLAPAGSWEWAEALWDELCWQNADLCLLLLRPKRKPDLEALRGLTLSHALLGQLLSRKQPYSPPAWSGSDGETSGSPRTYDVCMLHARDEQFIFLPGRKTGKHIPESYTVHGGGLNQWSARHRGKHCPRNGFLFQWQVPWCW